MFAADDLFELLTHLGVTHVTGVPDTTLGPLFDQLRTSETFRLVPVCREGEAWGIAAGLMLGGASPIVMIQCTGLFESGDSLRNAIHDFGLPLYALIGYRNYLNRERSRDTTLRFVEPIVDDWGFDSLLVDSAEQLPAIVEHYQRTRAEGLPGAVLLAEGAG